MKKKFILSLLMMIFATPLLAVADDGILTDDDFNREGACGTYHVLTAVFEQGFTCSAGTYLPQGEKTCIPCPSGYYCPGIGTSTYPCSSQYAAPSESPYCYSNSAENGPVGRYMCGANQYSSEARPSCSYCPTRSNNSNVHVDWFITDNGQNADYHDSQSDCQATFSLNKNGGSGVIQGTGGAGDASIVCNFGVECDFGNPLNELQQAGYEFIGWGTTEGCNSNTTKFTSPGYDNGDNTYYACKRGILYGPVTLDVNGGDNDSSPSNSDPSAIYIRYKTAFYNSSDGEQNHEITALSATPRWSGHSFIGFYSEPVSGGIRYIDEAGNIQNSAKDLLLPSGATWYARYEPNYTISLESPDADNHGTSKLYASPSSQYNTNASGVFKNPYNAGDGVGKKITIPERTGYGFVGYFAENDSAGTTPYIASDGTITSYLNERAKFATGNFEIYARWTPNTIKINWYGVQEAGARSESVQYDGDIITPVKATEKPHYKFNGWYFSLTPNN